MITLVAFDYGRTLFDREKDEFFPDAKKTILALEKRYILSIVSYSKKNDVEQRYSSLKKLGVLQCFSDIIFVEKPESKFQAYEKLIEKHSVRASQLAVVDDYVIRGVAYANRLGAVSIWLKKGKFSNELPDENTKKPQHIIHELSDLRRVLILNGG